MKKSFYTYTIFIMISAILLLMTGCRKSPEEMVGNTLEDEAAAENEDLIAVGFSQVGAESDWRNANTESIKSEFTEENGYKLIFEDAQQKQTNQITAIRSFIQQEVDYIVVAPVMENGWDSVLSEAKEAGIPVIVTDRRVDVTDEDLFTAWIGSDFELEAQKVCEWINSYTKRDGISGKSIRIVDLQGTLGNTAQIGRTKGFAEAADRYGWNVVAYEEGDFTQTKGREAMFKILRTYSDVNVVFCENDNEALGVIEAIESSGQKVGSDILAGEIMVVSFDGVNEEALSLLTQGKISCIGECNPNSGPKIRALIETLEGGGAVDKYEYLDERVFTSSDDISEIVVDGIKYKPTVIEAKDIIKEQ